MREPRRSRLPSLGDRSRRCAWVSLAHALLASLVVLATIVGASGATTERAGTPSATVDGRESHQRSALGDILSDLQDKINQATSLLNAGKNAFNQVGSSFSSLSGEINALPNKVNSVKNQVGGLVGTINEKVEGFVDEVYGKLFPTDAGAMVSDIAGKFFSTASLGERRVGSHFEDTSAIGSLVRKLNQDVLRDDLRRVLYSDYVSQLGAAHKRAAELGCDSLPANTTDSEAAKLGCTAIKSLTKACYEAPMRDIFPESAFTQEY
jgi:hypothetical protein